MNRLHWVLLTLLIGALIVGTETLLAAGKPAKPATVSVETVVEGNTRFALRMHQELSSIEGNLFFSPYSISSALGMTYAGARNQTEKEMREALCFPNQHEDFFRFYGELQEALLAGEKTEDIELNIANAIWVEKSHRFLRNYLRLVKKEYKSSVSLADFMGNADAERERINSWVEEQTRDKIKNLVPPGAVSELTRMVLVNAIYFKGDWARQFKEKYTRERAFYVSATESVEVEMMRQTETFRWSEDADTEALELPYEGHQLSMLVLLPKESDGIHALEQSLTVEKLNGLISTLREKKIEVTLPKFKVGKSYELSAAFKHLGMQDAFAHGADFSGMDGTRNLHISAILHKAFVEVDEQGTEAAAATAVVAVVRAELIPPRFNADHPFLFLIRDNATGSILFMGRVVNPTQE